MNRCLALLGMAKKAGLLAVGSEAAATAVRRGDAVLLITASDASEASVRRAKTNAELNKVRHITVPFTMFELGQTAGRGSPGTIAFLDKGLAEGFVKRLTENNKQNTERNSGNLSGNSNEKSTRTKESDA